MLGPGIATHKEMEGPGIESHPAGVINNCVVCCRGISDMSTEDTKVHHHHHHHQ
jgi:hypothetical protein